jgi:SAM-dependent methyltransferase
MDDYTPATYGDRIADVYEDWYAGSPALGDADAAASFLRDLAGEGPALELGIGTGRIALRLLDAGVAVHGIDSSEAMIERLRAKPGGERVVVTRSDFRDFDLGTRFTLVYVVFNTFFALLTQEDQIACFRAVARHVTPDGVFAMEAFVPDMGRFDRGQRVGAVDVQPDAVRLEITKVDTIAQRTDSQLVEIREDGIRLFPVRIRYAHVAELDLLARIAGMRLRERWADWDQTPLVPTSPKHISVWELEG